MFATQHTLFGKDSVSKNSECQFTLTFSFPYSLESNIELGLLPVFAITQCGLTLFIFSTGKVFVTLYFPGA